MHLAFSNHSFGIKVLSPEDEDALKCIFFSAHRLGDAHPAKPTATIDLSIWLFQL